MNFIKTLVRDYKVSRGLIPFETITLSSGVTLQHFVRREEKSKKRVIRIELKK